MSTPPRPPDVAISFNDYFDPVFNDLILQLMVRDRTFCARARGILQPGYFSGEVYQVICRALFLYWDGHQQLPSADALAVLVATAASVPEQRRVWADKARSLYTAGDVASLNPVFLGDQLAAFAQRAEAAMAVALAYQDIRNFDIDQITNTLQRVQQIPYAFTSLGIDVRAEWQRFLVEDIDGFPTGLPGIDRPMRGGAHPGELVIFVAPKKTGKSMILMNLAARLMTMGNNVAYITLELYDIDSLRRFNATISGAPTNRLEDHLPTVASAITSLDTFTEGRLIIKEFPGDTLTVPGLRSYLGLVAAQEMERATADGRLPRPTIPVIDYADLMKSSEGLSEWQAPVEIYTGLRKIGRELGVPVFSASQTNATGFGRRDIGAANLSGSTRKSFVADYMFYVEQDHDDYDTNRLRMIPKDNRNERRDLTSYWRTEFACARLHEISRDAFDRLTPGDPRA